MEGTHKRIMHYSSSQMILLVGEGDFSFSACLACAFGSAKNMVSTSLDCKRTLMVKHPTAGANLETLEKLGCTILHEVDCHTMNEHPLLKAQKFDKIIFNFPHAGFSYYLREHDPEQIKLHQDVVKGFFVSASTMLSSNGEVHVTHKTSYPFNKWEVEELAKEAGLSLAEGVKFKKENYPGYHNKRGDGKRSNESFPLGMCTTFKFEKEDFSGFHNKRGDGKITFKFLEPYFIPSLDLIACMWLDRCDPIWKPRPRRTRSDRVYISLCITYTKD